MTTKILSTSIWNCISEVIEDFNDLARASEEGWISILKMSLDIFDNHPTRWQTIYAWLDKPWGIRKGFGVVRWRDVVFCWPITRRRIRRLQRDLHEAEHALWARRLNTGKKFVAQ